MRSCEPKRAAPPVGNGVPRHRRCRTAPCQANAVAKGRRGAWPAYAYCSSVATTPQWLLCDRWSSPRAWVASCRCSSVAGVSEPSISARSASGPPASICLDATLILLDWAGRAIGPIGASSRHRYRSVAAFSSPSPVDLCVLSGRAGLRRYEFERVVVCRVSGLARWLLFFQVGASLPRPSGAV